MNNLYAKLKISPGASPQKIKKAIADCRDPVVQAAAQQLLSSPEDRKRYDQTHRLLTTLGILKTRLRVGFASNYDPQVSADYYHRERFSPSRKQNFFAKIKILQHPLPRKVKVPALMLAAFLVWNLGGYFVRPPVSPTPARPEYSFSVSARPPPSVFKFIAPPSQPLRYHSTAPREVPVVIKTPVDKNYFIKFEEPDGRLVADLFVAGGDSIEIKLPDNYYIIKYAQGNNWSGYKELFGIAQEVKYKKIINLVRFKKTTPMKKYIINIETAGGDRPFPVADIIRDLF